MLRNDLSTFLLRTEAASMNTDHEPPEAGAPFWVSCLAGFTGVGGGMLDSTIRGHQDC